MLRVCFILLLAVSVHPTSAEILSPTSNDIIATWPAPQDGPLTVSKAEQLLAKANEFNQPPLLVTQVDQFIRNEENNARLSPQVKLLKARLYQRGHQFSQARDILLPLSSPSAKLLLASVYNNLGEFEKSADVCKSLTGKVSHIIALTCQLDARFQAEPSVKIYKRLVKVNQLSQTENTEIVQWLASTLSSMALYLDRPEEALNHLSGLAWQDMTSPTVALWAEAQLATANPQKVLMTLKSRIREPDNLDDSLLFVLARAEQQLETTGEWTLRLADRIKMREWREDGAHAAYIAKYYLQISPDNKKAAHYAQLNWQHAKGLEDRALLAQTQEVTENG